MTVVRRAELEHVIAAAANVTHEDEFVVIGGQAILGTYPDPPAELTRSIEVDIFPARHPERASLIDGALGDGSPFHQTFGYYAHGVGPETARAPTGWEDRLVRVEIKPRPRSKRHPVALCLERHDLVLAKCAAGRERDWEYAREALREGVVEPEELLRRAPLLPIPPAAQKRVRVMLEGIIGEVRARRG